MKNLKVRLGAAAMSLTLLAGCICSCAKGSQKKKEILATDPWYTMDKLVLGTEYDPDDYVYLDFQLLGMSGGNFVTYAQGIKPLDKTFDPETDSYADFEIAHVNIYDETGAVVSSLDLMQLAEDNGYSVNDIGFNGTSLINDEVVCKFTKYTDNKFSEVTAVIDPATGEVKSIDETEPENEEDGTGSYVEGTEKVDGYTIMKKMIYLNESYSYALETTSPDGTVQTYDFSKEKPEMSIMSIPTIISMGDGKVLLYCQSDKKKNSKYMVYDMDANTCEEYKEDTDWLKDVTSMYTTQNVEGLGCFYMKQDGIKKIDFSAPLGSRFARLGRFPMGRAHPQGAVTRLCVKNIQHRRFDDDLFRRDIVRDKPRLHELGNDDNLLEARHRGNAPALRKDAAKRRFPRPAGGRAEKARPHAAGTGAVALERSVRITARAYRLVVVHVVDSLLRRKLLERRDVRALVHHNFIVPTKLPMAVACDIHFVPLCAESRDMPLGKDLYPAAHRRLLKIDKYLHWRMPFQCETRWTRRRTGASGISSHPLGRGRSYARSRKVSRAAPISSRISDGESPNISRSAAPSPRKRRASARSV